MTEVNSLPVEEIQKIIPHRYPFLLIDKVLDHDGENHITGLKNVTFNEAFFQGHFPGHPIMPGVLILEALAQTAACLLLKMSNKQGEIAYFMSMDSVKFRKPVKPGDQLILKIKILRMRKKIVISMGKAYVKNQLVSEAQMTFAFADKI